jgi:hypothetical protein
MIPQHSFHSAKNRSAQLLVSRGYEPVEPVTGSELAPTIHLHFIGMKGDYEALCVKLRIARRSLSETYVESLCRYDICQFRSLLLQSPGNVFLRCELWVVSPDNAIHCYEVLKTGIREVAAYAK